ncbi:MAG: GNAT family N-acetyltransferase [Planctomycetes bacterium]|nr:GNAT family N-acetyltransferase [Planctomycetota bacterium]
MSYGENESLINASGAPIDNDLNTVTIEHHDSALQPEIPIFEEYTESVESRTLQVKVYEHFEGLRDMQEEWDDLVEEVCGDIFMTYDWCRVWWKYYGKNRNLKVFVFRCDDDLVGIVPLFIEKIWLGPLFVNAVKIVGSDFTLSEFSLPVQDTFLSKIVAALAVNLKDLKWDILHIGPIAGLYDNYVELNESFKFSFDSYGQVQNEEKHVQTYYHLEESWEKHLSTLSKTHRSNIRKAYRQIAKVFDNTDKSVETIVTDSNNIEEEFNNFAEMHKTHWNTLNKAGHFGDWPKSIDFHLEMAKAQLMHDRLRLLKIVLDGECIGYDYGYRCSQNYFELLNARMRGERLGNVSIGEIIFSERAKKAIDEKVSRVDSLRGKYYHKIKMGGKLYPMHNIYVIRKGCLRGIRVGLFRKLSELYHFCYYRVWFLKVVPKVLKKRRPLNKLWIRTQGFS